MSDTMMKFAQPNNLIRLVVIWVMGLYRASASFVSNHAGIGPPDLAGSDYGTNAVMGDSQLGPFGASAHALLSGKLSPLLCPFPSFLGGAVLFLSALGLVIAAVCSPVPEFSCFCLAVFAGVFAGLSFPVVAGVRLAPHFFATLLALPGKAVWRVLVFVKLTDGLFLSATGALFHYNSKLGPAHRQAELGENAHQQAGPIGFSEPPSSQAAYHMCPALATEQP